MRVSLVLLAAFLPVACSSDETISAFAGTETAWTLTELDGAAFPARAEITFPKEGLITGRGPCNRFTATQNAPYPWIEIGPIASTRMACADLGAETRFLEALGAMAIAEVSGMHLLLTSEDGTREMLFTSTP